MRDGKKPKNVKRPRKNDLLDAKTVGIVQIAVGGMHCLALSHDNKIYSWGVNDLGSLGRDTSSGVKETAIDADSDSDDEDDIGLNAREATPAPIPSNFFPEGTKFAQIVAGASASFALTTTGLVYGWGTFGVSVRDASKEDLLTCFRVLMESLDSPKQTLSQQTSRRRRTSRRPQCSFLSSRTLYNSPPDRIISKHETKAVMCLPGDVESRIN